MSKISNTALQRLMLVGIAVRGAIEKPSVQSSSLAVHKFNFLPQTKEKSNTDKGGNCYFTFSIENIVLALEFIPHSVV
ncbi:MAG: hypothetical protein H7Y86_20825 [Rhizobacter sp.]|nr:hypothetical protein [Ferruginibacter sp.]